MATIVPLPKSNPKPGGTTTPTPTTGSAPSPSTAPLNVPALGTGMTPSTPTTASFNSTSGTASLGTASQVGALGTATASNVGPLANISGDGTINPYDSTNAASQVDAITKADSPYIQLAKQQGLLTAASRGLENSSLGAGASEAAAVAAAAPLAGQNAQEATQGQLQNSQLNTQASEFNSAQDAAAKELQAQMGTQVSQANAQAETANSEFNAQQKQSADAATAAAKNQMTSQTAALLEDMNKQNLSGAQAARVAQIQGNFNQLIASNQTAASLYTTYMSSLSAMLGNKDIGPQRVADAMTAMSSMLQTGLGVIDAMNGMNLDLTMPTFGSAGPALTVTPPKPTAPGGVAPKPGVPVTTPVNKPPPPPSLKPPTIGPGQNGWNTVTPPT